MKKDKSRFSNNINIKNKKAFYNFEIVDKYIGGIVLKGTEIKSIREGKVNLTEGYAFFKGDELFTKGVHISPYLQASFQNHEPGRERKLLLSRRELDKIKSRLEEKGLALIPLRLFLNDRGLAKLELGLGKGKKTHDKRDSIKEKDVKRDLQRAKLI